MTSTPANSRRQFLVVIKAMKNLLAGIGIGLVIIYAAGSGFWVSSGDAWYKTLTAPSWQPPDWVFGVIWPYNFLMLAVAAFYVASRLTQTLTVTFLVFFGLSVIMALAWSYLFYSRHDLTSAALTLALAAVLTLPVVLITWQASKVVGLLLIPYQLWIIIATTLSIGYALRN